MHLNSISICSLISRICRFYYSNLSTLSAWASFAFVSTIFGCSRSSAISLSFYSSEVCSFFYNCLCSSRIILKLHSRDSMRLLFLTSSYSRCFLSSISIVTSLSINFLPSENDLMLLCRSLISSSRFISYSLYLPISEYAPFSWSSLVLFRSADSTFVLLLLSNASFSLVSLSSRSRSSLVSSLSLRFPL